MQLNIHLHNISFRKSFVLLFVLGFIVRLIPEVLSYPYPIGADTFYYVERLMSGVLWSHWSQVFSTWLLYSLLIPVYSITQVEPFLFLKLVVPILYALNVCGIYYFAKKGLKWENNQALVAAFFFVFQLASLRVSWDTYRNLLGLAFLLFLLPSILNIEKRKDSFLFVLFSVLVVFSHEFASVIMFAVILGVIIKDFFKGKRDQVLKIIAFTIPALILFLMSIILRQFIYSSAIPFQVNVIPAGDTVYPKPGGLFFLVDYLNVIMPDLYYPTYLDLAWDVLSQFSILYLFCLPFVLIGFFKNHLLDGWTALLLVGTFSSIIIPFSALNFWNRWMYMLVYPFTFYTINGLKKALKTNGRLLNTIKLQKKTIFILLFLMLILAPPFLRVVKYSDFGASRMMLLHTTLPSEDVKDTIDVTDWLNNHMKNGSSLLVHEYFFRWVNLYLDKKHPMIYYFRDVQMALTTASIHKFDSIYMIWWKENVDWSYGVKSHFNINVPLDFAPVYNSGRVSVFEYKNSSSSA